MTNKLDYSYGNQTAEGTFRISASSIHKFVNRTNEYYRERLLGEPGFNANSPSVAGTCVHWAAECFTKYQGISETDRIEMYNYIALQASEEVDEQVVRSMITPMWTVLRDYLSNNPGTLAEPFIELPTNIQGITYGGSIDLITTLTPELLIGEPITELSQLVGHTVKLQDYKTTSRKPTSLPKKIEQSHSWQLLVYAKCLSELGIKVSQIEVIYVTKEHIGEISEKTGKQLKSYPSEVIVLTEPVTEDSLSFISGMIEVIAASVDRFINVPSDRWILAQDSRLKTNTATLPFTVGKTTTVSI